MIKFCFPLKLINFILTGIQKAKKKNGKHENSQNGITSTYVATGG